ncbi:MAG: DUF305 domain-containing protein [Acidobacteriota bacterium]|nr:DUF305 domain-containing protein [Acidobacteriota bacterium]
MRRILKNNYAILAALLLAVASLVGVACSTAPQTNLNNRNAATTNTTPAGNMMNNMNHGTMGGMDHSNMQSSPNAASQPYDLQFIDTMVMHHQGAIDMARMAVTKAQHAELREMAQKVITDQEREIAELRRHREQWFAGRPQAMNMEMSGMMDSMRGMDMNRLNAATGNSFDLMFIDMMIPHHQGAVMMAREALQRAEHPELKQLAQQIIREQEREIAQMNGWKNAWRQ